MDMFSELNYLAILVAAISSFCVGGLWYGPVFGKAWMADTGVTEEKAASANMPRTFGLAFVSQLVAALALATLLGQDKSLLSGALLGLGVAFAFIVTSLAVNDLFEQRPLRLWMINASNNLVAYTLMGAIIGVW